jgi:hypothetical protein
VITEKGKVKKIQVFGKILSWKPNGGKLHHMACTHTPCKIWTVWEAAWLMMVTCELTRNFVTGDVPIKVAAKFLRMPQFISV